MSILRPNIAALDAKFANMAELPGGQEALQSYIMNLAQNPANIGSPEYILAAGHLKTLKDLGSGLQGMTPKQPPFMAELLSGVDLQPQQAPMPQQMQAPPPTQTPIQLPEQAGGVAALPTPNLDEAEFAGGGIVAFGDGGDVERFQAGGPTLLQSEYDSLQNELRNYGFMQQKADPQKYNAIKQRLEALRPQLEKERTSKFIAANPMGAGVSAGVRNRLLPTTANVAPAIEPVVETAAAPVGLSAIPVSADQAPKPPMTQGDLRKFEQGQYSPRMPATTPPYMPKEPTLENTADAAALNTLSLDPTGIAALSRQFAGDTSGLKKQLDELPSNRMAVEERKDLYKQMGVDLDPYKALKERLEKETSEESKEEGKAGLMALAQFGFSLATQPGSFAQAVGKAGMSVLPSYKEDLKDLKKLSRDRVKTLADIRATDSKLGMNITDSALNELSKSRDKLENRIDRIDDKAAQIAGSIYGATLSANTQLQVGAQNIAAQKLDRDATRDERLLINAQKLAAQQVQDDQLSATKTAAQKRELVDQLTAQYYAQLKRLRGGNVSATQDDPAAAARAEMARRGIK